MFSPSPDASLRLNLFGPPLIEDGSGPKRLAGYKWGDLVLFLAVQPDYRATSDVIVPHLYPGAIHKQGTSPSLLRTEARRAGCIGFHAPSGCWRFQRSPSAGGQAFTVTTDYDEFQAAVQAARTVGIAEDVRQIALSTAERLCARGRFLEGCRGERYAWAGELSAQVEADVAYVQRECREMLRRGTTLHPQHPPVPAPLVGREEAIRQLGVWLTGDPRRSILLYGPPGIGKSALSFAALNEERVVRQYGDRRYVAWGDRASDAASLQAEITRALGIPVSVSRDILRQVLRARSPVVLVIDNLETPLHRDPEPCRSLLQEMGQEPGVTLLASYRGERREVGRFWDSQHHYRVMPLSEAAAQILFARTAEHPEWETEAAVQATVRDVDCVPLPILLLAHQAQDRPLKQFRAEWEKGRVHLLSSPASAARDGNWSACLRFSLQSPRLQNTPAALRLARILGVLPDGVEQEDLAFLLPEDTNIPEAVQALKAVGLIFSVPHHDRLRMLHPIREYLSTDFPPEEARKDWQWNETHEQEARKDWERIEKHYLNLLYDSSLRGGLERLTKMRDKLLAEIHNLAAVLHHALKTGIPDGALWKYGKLVWSVRFGDLSPLQKATKKGPPESRARYHQLLGSIYAAQFQHDLATEQDEAVLEILTKSDYDSDSAANYYQAQADRDRVCRKYKSAEPLYRKALTGFIQTGNKFGEANCNKGIADCLMSYDRISEARLRYKRAHSLYSQGDINRDYGRAVCEKRLGDCFFAEGRQSKGVKLQEKLEEAEKRYTSALTVFEAIPQKDGCANIAHARGLVAWFRGDIPGARHLFLEAIRIYNGPPAPSPTATADSCYCLSRIAATDDEREQWRTQAEALWAELLAPEQIAEAKRRYEAYPGGESAPS